MCASKITSETSEFDDVVAQRGSWQALVRDQFVEKILIEFREGLCWRGVGAGSIEHGDPEDSPAQDGEDGDEIHEPFCGSQLCFFGFAAGFEDLMKGLDLPSLGIPFQLSIASRQERTGRFVSNFQSILSRSFGVSVSVAWIAVRIRSE